MKPSLQPNISLCPSCYCMTGTIKGKCGKCKADKVSPKDSKIINPCFDKRYIRKSVGFKWWENLLLLFCLPYVAIDDGYAVHYKILFGKVCITKEEIL